LRGVGDGECVTLIGLRPNEWGGEYIMFVLWPGPAAFVFIFFYVYFYSALSREVAH
jgi:hypothetical protein